MLVFGKLALLPFPLFFLCLSLVAARGEVRDGALGFWEFDVLY